MLYLTYLKGYGFPYSSYVFIFREEKKKRKKKEVNRGSVSFVVRSRLGVYRGKVGIGRMCVFGAALGLLLIYMNC